MDNQSQVNYERQTIRIDFITLQGKPKHTEECTPQKSNETKGGGVCTDQAVPVDPRFRSGLQSLVQGLLVYATQFDQTHTCTTLLQAMGTHPKISGMLTLTVPIGY